MKYSKGQNVKYLGQVGVITSTNKNGTYNVRYISHTGLTTKVDFAKESTITVEFV